MTTRNILKALATALILFTLQAPAHATDIEDCRSKDEITNEARVKACSAVIDGKQASPADTAFAYYKRAMQYDKAIADLSSAIALTPDRWGLYSLRAMVYAQKKDTKDAIVDFKAALAHNPPATSSTMIQQRIDSLEKAPAQ